MSSITLTACRRQLQRQLSVHGTVCLKRHEDWILRCKFSLQRIPRTVSYHTESEYTTIVRNLMGLWNNMVRLWFEIRILIFSSTMKKHVNLFNLEWRNCREATWWCETLQEWGHRLVWNRHGKYVVTATDSTCCKSCSMSHGVSVLPRA